MANAAMRPGVPFSRLAGTAVTVREYLASAPADYAAQMADSLRSGAQHRARRPCDPESQVPQFTPMDQAAPEWQERTVTWAASSIRDTQELVDLGFPVFGTSICADSLSPEM